MAGKSHLKLVTPATVNRTVTPTRPPNADLRTREYLTEAEVERLMAAARKSRWGHRDTTMILVAYRHGFRPAELVDLRWDQIEFASGSLHVRRVKRGTPSTHPILGDELRALRRLQREQEPKSPFVFTSERGSPFTTAGFARMVERAGVEARLGFKAHPHMLRCLILAQSEHANHSQQCPLLGVKRTGAHKISEAVLLVCGEKGVSDGTGLRFYRRTPPPSRLLAFFDATSLRRMDDR
jgi:type 1 fimbriae regulatory protein FimB/type 1 fimbriae regulatory protein FimE